MDFLFALGQQVYLCSKKWGISIRNEVPNVLGYLFKIQWQRIYNDSLLCTRLHHQRYKGTCWRNHLVVILTHLYVEKIWIGFVLCTWFFKNSWLEKNNHVWLNIYRLEKLKQKTNKKKKPPPNSSSWINVHCAVKDLQKRGTHKSEVQDNVVFWFKDGTWKQEFSCSDSWFFFFFQIHRMKWRWGKGFSIQQLHSPVHLELSWRGHVHPAPPRSRRPRRKKKRERKAKWATQIYPIRSGIKYSYLINFWHVEQQRWLEKCQ